MAIVLEEPKTAPAQAFDRLHVRRFSIVHSRQPPHRILVEMDVELFYVGADGARVFDPTSRRVMRQEDYEAWLAQVIGSTPSPSDRERLMAMADGIQDILAALANVAFDLGARGPSSHGV